MVLQCTSCQSDNVQKIEIAYKAGTFRKSPLFRTIKPPPTYHLFNNWVFLFCASAAGITCWYFNLLEGMSGLFWWFGVFSVISIAVIHIFSDSLQRVMDKKELKHETIKARDYWKHGYICLRCGNRFVFRSPS